jgi:hypothetical protein
MTGGFDMTDPITTAIATAVATKAVSGLTEAGKRAYTVLMRLLRRKLAASPGSPDVLLSAQTHPTSAAHRTVLAEALADAMADDPHFAEQLAAAWRHVQEGHTATSDGTVHNVVSGDIDGSLVQARDIHGNVSLK